MTKNYTEEAITLAQKGGWEPKENWHFEDQTIYREGLDIPNIIWDLEHCFIDPDFWIALGKSLDMEKDVCDWCGDWRCGLVGLHCSRYNIAGIVRWWKHVAKEWFENRMSGGYDEAFFKQLIEPTQ